MDRRVARRPVARVVADAGTGAGCPRAAAHRAGGSHHLDDRQSAARGSRRRSGDAGDPDWRHGSAGERPRGEQRLSGRRHPRHAAQPSRAAARPHYRIRCRGDPEMNRRVALIALLCLAPGAAYAQNNETYDQAFEHYLETARKVSATPSTPWMGSLFTGLRARNVNDLVTINVVERIAASGQADSNLNKSSNVSASTGRIFGVDPKFADFFDPSALARFQASSDFKGGGATTRNGELSAVLTA